MGHEGHDHPFHSHAESPAAKEHKAHAPTSVATFVVTCSDSRSLERDESGDVLCAALERGGHALAGRALVRDDAEAIRAALEQASAAGARAVIFHGGTGIGRRDSTIEALRPLFTKELPGFGELFRMLSFQEIGSPAMLSRAIAGAVEGKIVFALPGSPQAVRLAMERLVLPELGHLVRELSR